MAALALALSLTGAAAWEVGELARRRKGQGTHLAERVDLTSAATAIPVPPSTRPRLPRIPLWASQFCKAPGARAPPMYDSRSARVIFPGLRRPDRYIVTV